MEACNYTMFVNVMTQPNCSRPHVCSLKGLAQESKHEDYKYGIVNINILKKAAAMVGLGRFNVEGSQAAGSVRFWTMPFLLPTHGNKL
jgi:hypothetical protein